MFYAWIIGALIIYNVLANANARNNQRPSRKFTLDRNNAYMAHTKNNKYEEKSLLEKQTDFKRHLRTYLVMSFFFFVLNLVTAPGAWWFYWPVIGWGIGVLMQGLSLYGPLRDPDEAHGQNSERLEPLPDLRDTPEPIELRELDTKPYRDEDLV